MGNDVRLTQRRALGKRRVGNVTGMKQKRRGLAPAALIVSVCGVPDQSGSPMIEVEPPLKLPVAMVGGAEPEQTGLPYLSSRAER